MSKTLRATTRTIEKKFAATAFTLTQERNDFFLPQVQDFVTSKKWFNLRPEYQRRLVWDDAKRSLFIESLLLNVPIPPVFLYETELNRYEVMDGQQRLNCIVEFLDNGFALKGLAKWSELNALRYKELPETLRRGLDRRRISATVLLVGSSESTPQSEVRKLVFERLNTGGQHLNAQELRNCFYAGPFNDMLIELARLPLFAKIWGIPAYDENIDKHGSMSRELRENKTYRRMIDCEIVLRYFALRKKSNVRGSVRAMLDRCMSENQSPKPAEIANLKKEFADRLNLARTIFNGNVFRYQDENQKWVLSVPLYDGVMIALDRLWGERRALISNRSEVVERIQRALKREAIFEVIVGRPNTAAAVQKRLDILTREMEKAI